MKIEYEKDTIDNLVLNLQIGNDEYGVLLNDEDPPLYETFIPKHSLSDFPIEKLIDKLVIKVVDHFELSEGYVDIPVINGTEYTFRKISADKLLISFEESGRRKFWDGEVGFKTFMEAKKKAIEERVEKIGDVKLENYDDDGDYIFLHFFCEFQTKNLSDAVTFSEQFLSQLETATNSILDDKLKKMLDIKDKDELVKFQAANLEIMKLAIENEKHSISEIGKLSPKVGAAIVRDGKLLGVAYRGMKGEGDHAEYTLFQKVLQGEDVSGATIFTTLEPCTHRNNHKPCSDWIIEKGIKHVVIGLLDPNPKIYNNGCKKLKAAGIEISYFPKELRDEIIADNAKFIEQYNANPSLSGIASFDYTNNNGLYIIGNNEMIFETKWTAAGEGVIHAYNDPGTIKTIAIADGNKEIDEIKDATVYNVSSRTRTVHNGEILVIENISGYFTAIKILEVKTKQGTHGINELAFEYRILKDRTSNFSA